jgi:deoxyadenosine/deoxycytidine kinase
MIFCITGSIASGKSTFIEHLYNLLKKRGYDVVKFPEPIELWQNVNGVNLLQLFYHDTPRWAFTFQINALLTMADIEKKAMLYSLNNQIVLIERSSYCAFEVFCKYLSKHVFSPAESEIIKDFKTKYSSLVEYYNKIVFIFLNTSFEICYARLNKRGRPEEIDQVSLEYLKKIEHLYEKSLENLFLPVIKIDGTSYNEMSIDTAKNMINGKQAVDEVVQYINNFYG